MPKQSLAEKSVSWLKVISLGLILGLGIQFAKAWTSPTLPPPGGNVSGPLTNGIAAQYKTGMLGINSTTTPVNALEVGGGGNAYIGGSLFTAGSISTTAGTVTGVLTSGKVQIVDVVMENTVCTSSGLVAKDAAGILLSCQGQGQGSPLRWKKASGGGGAMSPFTCFKTNAPAYPGYVSGPNVNMDLYNWQYSNEMPKFDGADMEIRCGTFNWTNAVTSCYWFFRMSPYVSGNHTISHFFGQTYTISCPEYSA